MERILKDLGMREWAKVINKAPNDKEMMELVPEKIILEYMDDCTTHISGKENVEVGDEEAIALCVVKNGEHYIHEFLDYYFKLGIKHIFFLDNGSTDETIEIAKNYNNISVFKCDLTYRKFWNMFKRFILEKFGKKNGWSLVVDIDEYFDFPEKEVIGLKGFLQYLNEENYNTVVTQMLDMFPKKGILASFNENNNFLEVHNYYDNDQLERNEYRSIVKSNGLPTNRIMFHQGGVRKRIFGLDTIFLTKHALIKYASPIKFEHDHYTVNARLADVTTVLYHYKFHGDFATYVDEAIESGVHWNNSFQYKQYKAVLEKDGDIFFYEDTSKQLENINQLVEEGFLVTSNNFISYCEEHNKKKQIEVNLTGNNGIVDNDTKRFMQMFEMQDRRYQYFTKKVMTEIYNKRIDDLYTETELSKKLKYNRELVQNANDELKILKKENKGIKKSFSFKLGYGVTRIPWALFGWIPFIKKRFD